MMTNLMRCIPMFGLLLMACVVSAPVFAAGSASRADLIYDPATGNVKIDPSEAAGGTITSFQFENGSAGFIPGNYSGPGGGFGTGVQEVSASTISDTDPTLVGFTSIHDFGNIFPPGLSQVQLEAFLTTKSYTGEAGSGQELIELIYTETTPVPLSSAPGMALLATVFLGLGFYLTKKRSEATCVA